MAKDKPAPAPVPQQSNGRKPDYRVLVSRQAGDKNFYDAVGVAWNVSSDGISIQLHALPIDGRLVMFPFERNDT